MVLRPEPMRRILVISSRGQQAALIDALHDLKAVNFIEHEAGKDGLLADFGLGAPLPGAGPASERLVRVRALLRHLGLEGAEPARAVPVRELEASLDVRLHEIESKANAALEARESLRANLAEGQEIEAKLLPLTALPLNLEDYRGYESLQVFVGRADPEGPAGIPAISKDALVGTAGEDLFVAFVPKAQAAQVQEHLYRHGYAEIEVPAGTGAPRARVEQIVAERARLHEQLASADATLAKLAAENRDFLLAAEEHLHIQVEKAEAPLSFAATEHAFVLDAWVPAGQYDAVTSRIRTATHDAVHIEDVEIDLHGDDHAHTEHGHEHDAGVAHVGKLAPRHVVPPTKYDNPSSIRRFEWFTNLFSVPRYDEVDPTLILSIFFPLFFGFMIGDLGLGLILALLGWFMMRKFPRVDGMKQLGTAFLVAGVIAAFCGGVLFADALGIPFGAESEHVEELAKQGLPLTCANLIDHAKAPTWSCLLGMGPHEYEPIIHKVTDVKLMLLISVVAAGVHLLIGMLLGIRNESGHGAKHVAAKIGFLVLLLGFYPAVLALLGYIPGYEKLGYGAAAAGFALGAILLGWAEGFAGVLEIPTVFSNILSYLRLGAVAIAKGAMAAAFTGLTLVTIGLAHHGESAYVIFLVLGLIAFVIVQLLLFVLGVLSAGIQAIRLNFVEFFTKFYKGGGHEFKPYGRTRVATLESESTQ